MAGLEERPVDGLGDYREVDDGQNDMIDDGDFGDLEMFDSNASQAMQSSAPAAIMSTEPPSSERTKKSKRDKKHKKDKKKHRSGSEAERSSAPAEAEEDALETDTLDATAEAPAAEAPVAEEDDQTRLNKKRKHRSSSEGKGRKKQRSHSEADNAETQEDIAADGDAEDTFLTKHELSNAANDAIYENIVGEADTAGSPSADRLRRRSESRSRASSIAPAADEEQMNVDENGEPNAKQLNGSAQMTDLEMGDVAQQAADAMDLASEQAQHPSTDPANAEELQTTPASNKRRSGRAKKAKPTYFEQPPVIDDNNDNDDDSDGVDNLPSPSAITPRPRNRTKQSSRTSKPKKKKAEKLSHSMRGGPDDGYDADGNRRTLKPSTGIFTQGRFSDEELALISKAVEDFRVDYKLTQPEVNAMIQAAGGTTAGDDHAQLWVRILETCPDRHRQKIINITRKKFHNFVARGTWTKEQDQELADMIAIHGQKWSQIAAIINRHPEDVRDRFRNYIVCGDSQRKDAWNEGEEKRLTQYVIEAMEAIDELRAMDPDRDLLKKPYEELIDWQNISERMDRTRSRLQCITKWKSMNIRTNGSDKLASGQPDAQISFRLEKARRQLSAMPEEERFRFVLAIQATNASTEAKVPWQRLVDKTFRNQWHRTTQVLLWRRLKMRIPEYQEKSLRACADYLVELRSQSEHLPDVEDELFDVSDEMAFMEGMASSGTQGSSGGGSKGKKKVPVKNFQSEEYAMDSEEDGGAAAADGAGDITGAGVLQQPSADDAVSHLLMADDDLQIDPALAASTAPRPPLKPQVQLLHSSHHQTVEDPIAMATLAEAATALGDNDDIDVEMYRKKKTPSKFKTFGQKNNNTVEAPAALMAIDPAVTGEQPLYDDSEMMLGAAPGGDEFEGGNSAEEAAPMGGLNDEMPMVDATTTATTAGGENMEVGVVSDDDDSDMEDIPSKVETAVM